ncbi:tyro protein tyrosine kinase-binding protein [Eisenbergiella sp.]
MTNENNHNYAGMWIFCALLSGGAWIALLIAKACGAIRTNWIVVLLGAVWLPVLVLAFLLGLAGVLALLSKTRLRIREWKRRRKISRTLWEAMEGLTLNSIGPIYGVKRQQGEQNRSYKRRILKAARTVDTVNVQNPPFDTGERLDRIAKLHGLSRKPHERDAQLQNRIRAAVNGRTGRRKAWKIIKQ